MAAELNEGRPEGRIDGWPAITAALEALLLEAMAAGAPRIALLDPDFARWPLSSPAVLAALQAWGNRNRRLELLAPDWSACERRHPRLLAWRRGFDHLLDIRRFDPADGVSDWPFALAVAARGACLRVLDLDDGRAVLRRGAADRQLALEVFDAIAQRSEPAWPLTTLGL